MKESLAEFEKKVFELMNACEDVTCLEMSLIFMGLSVTMANAIEAPLDAIEKVLRDMLDELLILERDKGEKPSGKKELHTT